MAREEQYLVRGADGRMVTVNATSLKAAKLTYLRRKKPKKGTQFAIKRRGDPAGFAYYNVI